MKLINKTNNKKAFNRIKSNWIIMEKEEDLNYDKIKRSIEIEGCFDLLKSTLCCHLSKAGNIIVTAIV